MKNNRVHSSKFYDENSSNVNIKDTIKERVMRVKNKYMIMTNKIWY